MNNKQRGFPLFPEKDEPRTAKNTVNFQRKYLATSFQNQTNVRLLNKGDELEFFSFKNTFT